MVQLSGHNTCQFLRKFRNPGLIRNSQSAIESRILSVNVLLVNPPIFDFSAYDFWLRPYGMMRVAGRIRHAASLSLFDFLRSTPRDEWGRGRYSEEIVQKPALFGDIPRYFRRYGRPRAEFREFLSKGTYDVVLIQTMMTYWYPGVREAIEDLRDLQPHARIVLGGIYCTICPEHASSLGADLVIKGGNLEPLWQLLSFRPGDGLPAWFEPLGEVGVLKLTEGCPFRCTYCSVPLMCSGFDARPTGESMEELRRLVRLGARQVVFYDDALLYKPAEVLIPFLEQVIEEGLKVSFHTPNALNASFVTAELARLMVRSGFRTWFLGFESAMESWQRSTGGKVTCEGFASAMTHLRAAGANNISAYIVMGHPDSDEQEIEASMRFVHRNGAKVQLAEFSPIPGTPDGDRCGPWADLAEPLSHNKTAFTHRRLGPDRLSSLKELARELNSFQTQRH